MIRKKLIFNLIATIVTVGTMFPIFGETVQAKVLSADISSTESANNTSDAQQMINQANNNTVLNLSADNAFEVQSTQAHYKEGVTKVVSHSATTGTMYVSRSLAVAIVEGEVTAIGGLSGNVVATLLQLAGITTSAFIKGGIKINYEYIQGSDGQYHVAYTGYAWQ
ncbi:hypothetical protein [Lentilactobacillus otakiensis]|uniref:hypothetical protein n=1 Tax=Lentilactobacillus otakiensis TaxID=481720 RepID=UPI003D186A67